MTPQTAFTNWPPYPPAEYPGQSGLVAYFSMEIAITPAMPTYSGGLGVLAGDTLRAAAELGLAMVAVTLAHRKGYFKQRLDENGVQREEDQPWDLEDRLTAEEPVITVLVEGRTVAIRAWRYDMEGVTGHTIPIYLLDTNLEQNDPLDRELTDHLYGGDGDYRLRQEMVLGIGAAPILEALCYRPQIYHLNEGHASLLTIALLERQLRGRSLEQATGEDLKAVREQCVFTTHTPVPAGHDRFSMEQAYRILGSERGQLIERAGGSRDGLVNMTYMALRFARYVNGVAMQHGKVSREMFPDYTIGDHDDEIDEANALHHRLEHVILPLFYGQHDAWRRVMRSTIAINGPYFNTERMLKQYVSKAYFPGRRLVAVPAAALLLAS